MKRIDRVSLNLKELEDGVEILKRAVEKAVN
jgi:hypothetical protein